MSTTDQPQDSTAPAAPGSWKLDYKWSKMQLLVTDTTTNAPVALAHCNLRTPHLDFRTADDSHSFGTGEIHYVSIHSDYTLNSFSGELRASSRWYTRYQHLSPNFGTPSNPMVMSWSSKSSFKDWDFICSDENGEAVARFSTRVWALKRIGVIEFVGPKAESLEARREILVTGTLLHHTMLTRVNNPLNLMYSICGKAGPIQKEEGVQGVRGVEGDAVEMGKYGETVVVDQPEGKKVV